MHNILIKPLITEKMSNISAGDATKFGFVVAYNANKIQIAQAIKQKFNVDVVSVNTIKYKGKSKTQFTRKGRFTGKSPRFKKAVVTLKEGQTIDIFSQV